jgi:hypothetical protein
MKSPSKISLRCQVEKWLAPAPAIPVHVIEFGRTRWGGSRYVCVETADGARALFFFRHDDDARPTATRVAPPVSTLAPAQAQTSPLSHT